MSNEKISCRIAIQICVGRLSNGRESHRTFSLKDVCPDVSMETVLHIVRALAPLLEYPITKVTKVTKRVLFSEEDAGSALPAPQVNAEPVPESARIIPFPVFSVTERPAVHRAVGYDVAESSRFAGAKGIVPGRAPPA